MTPERWQRVKDLFRSALEHEVAARDAFLDRACNGDNGLRREVESLLASFEDSDHFIETPVAEAAAALFSEDQAESLVGHRLGHYQIVAMLGEGGMGTVYLAQDTKLGRKVAVKLLPTYFTSDADRLRRFEQEACAASLLNHPNILTIYETGQLEGRHFIATEFIDGETLRASLARAQMKIEEALDIGAQVASALAAAHAAGIVHRDIKPENVMVRRDALVKVLDFGLAKLTEQQPIDPEAATRALVKTASGVVMGTVHSMSPEQARGVPVDARTDVWSLGCLLYEMVGGRVPFEGGTSSDVIAAILEREPPPLARYAPDVPTEVEWIVRKALRKDREERYQTAKELLTDLKTLKQRLEFEAELERSAPLERVATVAASASGGHTLVETAEAAAAHPTSSAEYVTSEIKKHKSASIAGLVILLLAIGGLGFWYFNNRLSNSSQIESIAVLPFQNVTGNSDTEYLSDGISEALINSLAELRQLRVVARSTAFRYKGREVDPQAIGRDLRVRAVLMGRVRQTGDRLNVQVDLVDASTGAQLWGEEYERKVADLLPVKQAIAREVTEKLRLRLSGEEQRRLVSRDTTNAEAYQLYLRGRYLWNKRTPEGLKKALEQFQQAIDHDPNYALGYVGLADCYVLLEQYAGFPASETLPRARAAADRALQLDDSLPEAHTSSAVIYRSQWRWAEAEEEHRRAVSLNPNYPTAHQWFSGYYIIKRQFDDALREIKRAQELDPLSSIINDQVAWVHLFKNDLNSVVEQCQRNIELNPSFPGTHYLLGSAYLKQRRYEEATTEFQNAVEFSGRASEWLSPLGYCYAVTRRRAEALRILKELEEKYARREALGQHLAEVYAGLGEKDQAFGWLEKDFDQRSGWLPLIVVDYSFEDLRSDPRYADLVRRMGLTP